MIFQTPTKKESFIANPCWKSTPLTKNHGNVAPKQDLSTISFSAAKFFGIRDNQQEKLHTFSKISTFGYIYTSTDFCSYFPFPARSSRDERFAQAVFWAQNYRSDGGVSILNSAISEDVLKVWETIPWKSKDYSFCVLCLTWTRKDFRFSREFASSTILG